MEKLNRKYQLLIQTAAGTTLQIEPPFTVEFDITRNVLTSANVCQIRIYNLNVNNRNQLRFDISNYGEYRSILFKAGYGSNLATVFSGNISKAWSVREESNFVTTIECYDGGWAMINSTFNQQFISGTPQSIIVETMIDNLQTVSKGAIGEIEGDISRGNSFSGNAADLIAEAVPNKFFIDNQKAFVLGTNECIEGELQTIDSQSGLLGTPVREETILHFDMIFEPRLKIGQRVLLESSTEPAYNGEYKTISLKHRGMISEVLSGNAITNVGLFAGAGALSVVTDG